MALTGGPGTVSQGQTEPPSFAICCENTALIIGFQLSVKTGCHRKLS